MIVDCAVYEAGRRRPGELPILHACEASRQDNAFVWIGLYEPTEEEFEAVRREFDLHELRSRTQFMRTSGRSSRCTERRCSPS